MRLRADLDRCRGAGQCVFTAPDLFDQDDAEGLVVVLDPAPGPDRLPLAARAADACPNQALSLSPD